MNIVNHDLKFGRERARDMGIGTHVPYLGAPWAFLQ